MEDRALYGKNIPSRLRLEQQEAHVPLYPSTPRGDNDDVLRETSSIGMNGDEKPCRLSQWSRGLEAQTMPGSVERSKAAKIKVGADHSPRNCRHKTDVDQSRRGM